MQLEHTNTTPKFGGSNDKIVELNGHKRASLAITITISSRSSSSSSNPILPCTIITVQSGRKRDIYAI